MDKLQMHSRDAVDGNVAKIAAMFPHCVTERKDKDGNPELAIDFDKLRAELSKELLDEGEERYQFTWPDKRAASRLANKSSYMTLRPDLKKSLDFWNTENLYIEGDNLNALKVLREDYLGQVDVIYIDPPYNTGRNLIYKNNFYSQESEYVNRSSQFDDIGNMLVQNPETNGRFHTDWINMLYPRLKVSRDLLSENGIMVLTIDDCEIETVTMVLNEIFGESNHLGTIIIKNNPSGRSTQTGISISHEYALFYSKNNDTVLGRLPRNDKQISRYKEIDDNGHFEWVNFRKHGGYREDAPSMYYPIVIKKDGSSFRIPKMKWNETEKVYSILETILDDEFISYPKDEAGRDRRWKWGLERTMSELEEMTVRKDRDGQYAVYIKSRMNDDGMLPLTVWDDKKHSSTEYGTNFLINLLGARYFDYPKSIYAVIDCLKVANCKPDSIVLDFFSGSATTAHAVMKLNAEDGGHRKFIMVQLPEVTDGKSEARKAGYKTICEIGEERIRRAGRQIINDLKKKEAPYINNDENLFAEDSSLFNTQRKDLPDVGFRVLKLDSSNMEDVYYLPEDLTQANLFNSVDNVKSDRTPLDLLFQVMPELNIELSAKIEEKSVNGKKVFFVDGTYLIATFDMDVNESTVTEIAKVKPQYFVMRDASAANDNVLDNFEQIFRHYSPDTIRKII